MNAWLIWLAAGGVSVVAGSLLMLGAGITATQQQREDDGDLIAVAGVGAIIAALGVIAALVGIVGPVAEFLGRLLT